MKYGIFFRVVVVCLASAIMLVGRLKGPAGISRRPTGFASHNRSVAAARAAAAQSGRGADWGPDWDSVQKLQDQTARLDQEQAAAPLADTARHLKDAVGPPSDGFGWDCHGARMRPEFVSPETQQWLADNVLFAIITGESYSNRIQTSLCNWMPHVPMANLLLFTDVPNPKPHPTPYGTLRPIPYDLTAFYDFKILDAGSELYSVFYEEGMYSSMVNQKKKTNYPLGWVKAQYRFAFALHTLTLAPHCAKYKILFLLDDDTFVNWNNLVNRVQQLDPKSPVYLNSQGWGGSGHLFTAEGARRLHPHLKRCVYDYMIKKWGSSDGMLMKCVQRGGIQNRNEPNFQWWKPESGS